MRYNTWMLYTADFLSRPDFSRRWHGPRRAHFGEFGELAAKSFSSPPMPRRWALLLLGGAASGAEWTDWLARFGHDDYVYPWWISSQMLACNCTAPPARCVLSDGRGGERRVDWRAAVADDAARRSARGASADGALTYCIGKAWLLEHMPPFDLAYLPPAVSVNGTSTTTATQQQQT